MERTNEVLSVIFLKREVFIASSAISVFLTLFAASQAFLTYNFVYTRTGVNINNLYPIAQIMWLGITAATSFAYGVVSMQFFEDNLPRRIL